MNQEKALKLKLGQKLYSSFLSIRQDFLYASI